MDIQERRQNLLRAEFNEKASEEKIAKKLDAALLQNESEIGIYLTGEVTKNDAAYTEWKDSIVEKFGCFSDVRLEADEVTVFGDKVKLTNMVLEIGDSNDDDSSTYRPYNPGDDIPDDVKKFLDDNGISY